MSYPILAAAILLALFIAVEPTVLAVALAHLEAVTR